MGQWDKDVADQTKAIELKPDYWEAYQAHGWPLGKLGQWDKAVADYTKAIDLGATAPQIWVAKAAAHAQLNQPEEAVAELRQAVARGFRDVKLLKTRSDLAGLRSREDFQQLISELEAKTK